MGTPIALSKANEKEIDLALIQDQDQNFLLVIKSISDSFIAKLNLETSSGIIGSEISVIFPDDQSMVDEWLEYILKTKAYPKKNLYDEKIGEEIKRFWFQYSELHKTWVVTTLSTIIGSEVYSFSFSNTSATHYSLSQEHLVEIKKSNSLSSFQRDFSRWEIDFENNTIFISRKLANELKISNNALFLPIETFQKKIILDDNVNLKCLFNNINKNHKIDEIRFKLDDNTVLHFTSYAFATYNSNGDIISACVRSHNITEKYSNANLMSISEQRFKGIVENSCDMFLVTASTGEFLYVSPNVNKVLGWNTEEMLGLKFHHFVSDPSVEQGIRGMFENLLKNKISYQREYLLPHANGHPIWCYLCLTPIYSDNEIVEIIATCRDITSEKEYKQNLKYMSSHDPLTKVYNRFRFERESDRIMEDSTVDLGLILADVNGLKQVNDAYGHKAGDQVLVETAELLTKICKGYNKVFRVGGDEFAIYIYNCSSQLLEELCDKIALDCAATSSNKFPISLAIGSAMRTNSLQNIHDLYRQSEGRMYSNKMFESSSMHSQLVNSLKETLKSRTVETADHMQRMETMVVALGKRLKLLGNEFDNLLLLASMHDIGKVAIPDSVINKPGRLSDDEWGIMRTHCEIGSKIARTSQELSCIAFEISCHHEFWNGKGYPHGYSGDRIPLLSRIISVVDTYDVMTNHRVYKTAVDHPVAIEELKRCSGTQFDPSIVDLFLDIFGELTPQEMINMKQLI